MRTSTSLLIAGLTLTLTVPSTVRAQLPDWGADRYDRRCDTRYDVERVAILAHDVEETATRIHYEAERNNRRPNRDEARMLEALHLLNEAAAAFHDRVEERWGGGSSRGAGDFEDLVRAYYETGYALDRVNRRPYIDQGMERIGALLTQLSGYYGRSRDHRFTRGWGDRYDHDRYDRDRYDHDGYGDGRYGHDGYGRGRGGHGRYGRDGWNDRRDRQ
ncbi:MAG TPA: hypothetical protein DD490_32780 [Acidobacteria bacterium]|nr:hypothetical protein [Acidobacteriota bacterium]